MRTKIQNVQNLDKFSSQIRKLFPSLKFRAKQTTTTMLARGWGVRFKRKQTQTSLEPIEDLTNEG